MNQSISVTEVCYDHHVEYYGNETSVEFPVGNSTQCGEICLANDNCNYFAFRELNEECYLMSELYGVLKKGAFKITSGFKWRNATNVQTCANGNFQVSLSLFYSKVV